MSKNNISYLFGCALLGHAIALALLFCLLVVTERAENVSRETMVSQNAEQAAELPEEETQAAEIVPLPYSHADAEALARMAWGESGGVGDLMTDGKIVSADYQKAATMWCGLNRYDAGYAGSIFDVIAANKQFHGYDPAHQIDEELLALAYDVLDRWAAERSGAADVGRVLPAEYLYFVGDGKHNYFTAEYGSGIYYAWTLPDVYAASENTQREDESK